MEERLFFIGLAMGAYAWTCRRWDKTGAVDTAFKAGLWHGLFCALAGFSITVILLMSLESRSRLFSAPGGPFSRGEAYPGLAVALAAGLVGFWRAAIAGRAAQKRRHFFSEDWEWSETVFSAVLLASVLMYFVIQAFKIPSGSMRMTFLEGDHLFVNKFIYGFRVPLAGRRVLPLRQVARGDVLVFRFPSDNSGDTHCGSSQYGKDFIKRVIALPGDLVEVREGRVFLNGRKLEREPYAQYLDSSRQPESAMAQALGEKRYQNLWQNHGLDHELADVQRDFFGPVTVPEKSYFVMGDNRDRSCDSRYWGPVESRYVKGKAWFVYWPPSRMGLVQ